MAPDDHALETISIPDDVFPEPAGTLWTYEVDGDSMTGDGISPGDYVVVDLTQVPGDGDIAAVHISKWRTPAGELTRGWLMKRLRNGGTVLESSNPAYPPMVLGPEHKIIIRGTVIGVVTCGPDRQVVHARRIREPRASGSPLPVVVAADLDGLLRTMGLHPGDLPPSPGTAG